MTAAPISLVYIFSVVTVLLWLSLYFGVVVLKIYLISGLRHIQSDFQVYSGYLFCNYFVLYYVGVINHTNRYRVFYYSVEGAKYI